MNHPTLKTSAFALAFALGTTAAWAGTSTRIVNGDEAPVGAYPWMVSIGSANTANAKDAHSCGGSLIRPTWVLTAAHCVVDNDTGAVTPAADLMITEGRHRLTDSGGVRVAVKQVIVHPGYDRATTDNDITLLELAQPIDAPTVTLAIPATDAAAGTNALAMGWGGLAAPMGYAAATYQVSSNQPLADFVAAIEAKGVSGKDLIATMLLANGLKAPEKGIGWKSLENLLTAAGGQTTAGMTYDALYAALEAKGVPVENMAYAIIVEAQGPDELRQVDLPVVANQNCTGYEGRITDNMLCAGYTDKPLDTCQGDSGGPLVVPNDEKNGWTQVGVVSFGGVCATGYGIYARVSRYASFISQNVPECGDGNPPTSASMNVNIAGSTASADWSAPGAFGYRFYFAPYSNPVDQTTLGNIQSADMGANTSISATLASGQNFYVAVKGYNCFGRSPWSNIGTVLIP